MSAKKTSVVIAVVMMLPLSAALGTSLPVTATLTLVPDTTLPGLPVAFMVTIDNPNDVVHSVGNFAVLTVTTGSGTFDATDLRGRNGITINPSQMDRCGAVSCLTVPAHGQRQLYIDIEPTLAGNEFFADQRLSQPGTYGLQLALYESASDGERVLIRTNPATLTVQQPSGADLAVWQLLQKISEGRGWTTFDWITSGESVASEIRANYRSSTYATWVAAIATAATPEAGIAQLDEALSRNPPPSLRDDLLWSEGAFAAKASSHALDVDRNIDQSLAFADMARSAYETLQKVAISDVMRRRASDDLAHIYTRRTAEDELRREAANDPPAPLTVEPRVECVTRGAGQSFTARFGYSNPNAVMKVLPLGNLNEVTPAPRDQGQPRVFKTGDHPNVFTASSAGGEIKWHLDGHQASATPEFPVRCVSNR